MRRLLRFLPSLFPIALITAALAQPASPGAPASTAAPAATDVPASTAAPSAAAAADTVEPDSAPQHAPSRPAFPVEELRLDNGLRVVLAPDASLPNVAVQLRYDVGSKDE